MREEMDYVSESEIAVIMAEYQKKQLVETVVGPSVSLIFHVILLLLMFIFLVTSPTPVRPPIEVEIVKLEEIVLTPEVIEEVMETDEQELTPSEIDTPSISQDLVSDSLSDLSDDAPMTDDASDAEEISDVVIRDSFMKYSGPLGGRDPGGRKRLGDKYGASKGGQERVSKALRWLAKVQNTNGSWGSESPAHTGLALLVFLAHGETPLSEEYGKTVQSAMRWLCAYAEDSKTMSVGVNGQRAYGHGIATYAIAESYAMTKIPFMQIAMERSVDIIVKGQQPGGGFDYSYKKGERWDLSVAGWQIQALKAAKVAGSANEGLGRAIEECVKFCKNTAYANGKFGYSSAGSGGNMTGVGVVALQLLGGGKFPETKRAMEAISKERFESYVKVADKPQEWTEISEKHLYGWYYDTQAMFNASEQLGMKKEWKAWRKIFEKVLIRAQNPEGYWETKGHIGGADIPGRILSTCFSCLQLEVYYRYLPTFDINKMDAAAEPSSIDTVGSAGSGVVIDIGR